MECPEKIDLINMDISTIKFSKAKAFDTIVMNPPFGTRKEGIDLVFLKKGIEV